MHLENPWQYLLNKCLVTCNWAHFITQDEDWKLHPVKWLELFLAAELAAFSMLFPDHPYDSQLSPLSF